MPHSAIQYYFAGGQFIMPASFDLPPDLLRSLGIDSYRIHSGAYSIQEDHEFITVDF